MAAVTVSLAEPEGEEGPVLEVAADDNVVLGLGVADVLHAEVVLVGVEVGLPVVAVVLREDGPSGELAVPDGVVPVLDP